MPRPNGAQIRKRRKERGLTTAQLAARVGFTNDGSLRNIESRNDPIAEIKLHRIARELGVAIDEIVSVDIVSVDAASIGTGSPDRADDQG